MSFIGELISEFTHKKSSDSEQEVIVEQQTYNNYPPSGGPQPPQVPYPWRAIWDSAADCFLYMNDQTGERTFQNPMSMQQQQQQQQPPPQYGYGGAPGYRDMGPSYGGSGAYSEQPPRPYESQGYGAQPPYNPGPPGQSYQRQETYVVEEPQQEQKSGSSHALAYGAVGAVAGLAGGALLMHEGEKIEENWDEDKARVEGGFDRAGEDIVDAPENMAEWTGEKVQEVEDLPEDIAQDVGSGVGRVEQGWDNLEDSYDQGRDEQRYEDDYEQEGGW